MRLLRSFFILSVLAFAFFTNASAAPALPSRTTCGGVGGYAFVTSDSKVYGNGGYLFSSETGFIGCASNAYGICAWKADGSAKCTNTATFSNVEWISNAFIGSYSVDTYRYPFLVKHLDGTFSKDSNSPVHLSRYASSTHWAVSTATADIGVNSDGYGWIGSEYGSYAYWTYSNVFQLYRSQTFDLDPNARLLLDGSFYYDDSLVRSSVLNIGAAHRNRICVLGEDYIVSCYGNSALDSNAPDYPVRDVFVDSPNVGADSGVFYAVRKSDNKVVKWSSTVSVSELVSAPVAFSSGGSSSEYCVSNPSGSGSVTFSPILADSSSVTDEHWWFTKEFWDNSGALSVETNGVNVLYGSMSTVSKGFTGYVTVEPTLLSLGYPSGAYLDYKFSEELYDATSSGITYFRPYVDSDAGAEYALQVVYRSESVFDRWKYVEVDQSLVRSVGGVSFYAVQPVTGFLAVGFRVKLLDDGPYYVRKLEAGYHAVDFSATGCKTLAQVAEEAGQTAPATSSGSSLTVPASPSFEPGYGTSYSGAVQDCSPKLFSGSLVSYSGSSDPTSCAFRLVGNSYSCQSSDGQACVQNGDVCLQSLVDPEGVPVYSPDLTRYECSVAQVQCQWYSKNSCGPTSLCYQDGDYCRVKPENVPVTVTDKTPEGETSSSCSGLGCVSQAIDRFSDRLFNQETPGVLSSNAPSSHGFTGSAVSGSLSGSSQIVESDLPDGVLSRSCEMFDDAGFVYQGSNPIRISFTDAFGSVPLVIFVTRPVDWILMPLNNTLAVAQTFIVPPDGSELCLFGSVYQVNYQGVFRGKTIFASVTSSGPTQNLDIPGFPQFSPSQFVGKETKVDYVFLFVFGLVACAGMFFVVRKNGQYE